MSTASNDPLARAEQYLERVRSGERVPVSASGESGGEADLVERLDGLIDRLGRLERTEESLAPRGGRQAAQLRSDLLGERAQIYVQIGAVVALWAKRGGDVTLSMDPDRTAVIETVAARSSATSPLVFPDDLDPDETIGAAETLLAVRPVASVIAPSFVPAPPRARSSRDPAPSLESLLLQETRRSIRAVSAPELEGPPPDIFGSDPGAPPPDASASALEPEILWLDEQGSLLPRWRGAPGPLQHAVLSWLTARARWCQELLGPGDDAERVARLYPRLSAFSKRERPGFVYGLRRDHKPAGGSWRDDAASWRAQALEHQAAAQAEITEGERNPERALAHLEALLEDGASVAELLEAAAEALGSGVRSDDPRLLKLVVDWREELTDDPRFKRLRRALRAQAGEDADASSEPTLVEDSSLFGDVDSLDDDEIAARDAEAATLRILMVGGEPREVHRQRLEVATGVAELSWAPASRGGGTGKLQSTAESIRSGSWDGVVLLPRFCGHDVDAVLVPACKASNTPWLHLRGGYGVAPMRQAVRHLVGQRSDASVTAQD